MKLILPVCIIYALLFISTGCSRKEITGTKALYGISGPVSIMTETSYSSFSEKPLKLVFYFDRKGNLEKVEEYNLYVEQDSIGSLGDITYYNNTTDTLKTFYTVQGNTQNQSGSIRLISDSVYLRAAEANQFKTKKYFYLDKNSRVMRTEEHIVYQTDTIHVINKFLYKNNKLVFVDIENAAYQIKKRLKLIDTTYDNYGNPLKAEYLDEETGKIFERYEREYTYYK